MDPEQLGLSNCKHACFPFGFPSKSAFEKHMGVSFGNPFWALKQIPKGNIIVLFGQANFGASNIRCLAACVVIPAGPPPPLAPFPPLPPPEDFGWLVGWLVGWLAGWLAGRLVGAFF